MSADLEAAEQFMAGHARVLERRRFARLFGEGPAGRGCGMRWPRSATRTVGLGMRSSRTGAVGPESQPAAVLTALRGAGRVRCVGRRDRAQRVRLARDDRARGRRDAVRAAGRGGVAARAVVASGRRGLPASLTTTGQVLGAAAAPRRRASVGGAGDRVACGSKVAGDAGDADPYDVHEGLVAFLDGVQDTERAARGGRGRS